MRNRVGLLFIAFLEERECVEKTVMIKDVLVSTFSFLNARETPPKFTLNYVFCRN